MHLLVGLGNPGRLYQRTRHNIGFDIVDALARTNSAGFLPGRGDYEFARCSLNARSVLLAKPTTYMNNSGLAVADLMEYFEIQCSDLLVVCDDFQLPLGSLRLRGKGSDGGHNGLASIIYHLQDDAFARLRCGIGTTGMAAGKTNMADFVLDRFAAEESALVAEMIHRAEEACCAFVEHGLQNTMNRFNRKPEGSSDKQSLT